MRVFGTLHLVLFINLACYSQRQDKVLRYNLISGLRGHFNLLKDVNIFSLIEMKNEMNVTSDRLLQHANASFSVH